MAFIPELDGAERPSWTDLSVNGIYPTSIRRHYDSRSTNDSPLGHGRALRHDRRLFEYPDGSVRVGRSSDRRFRHIGGTTNGGSPCGHPPSHSPFKSISFMVDPVSTRAKSRGDNNKLRLSFKPELFARQELMQS